MFGSLIMSRTVSCSVSDVREPTPAELSNLKVYCSKAWMFILSEFVSKRKELLKLGKGASV